MSNLAKLHPGPLLSPPSHAEVQRTVDATSSSALTAAKRNFRYLINPSASPSVPLRFRTRALLRTLHYLCVFIFWRVVRYAKYAAVGAAMAALSATALGSVFSGAAFIAAPSTMAASVGLGMLWTVGQWGFRKAAMRTKKGGEQDVAMGRAGKDLEPTFLSDTFV